MDCQSQRCASFQVALNPDSIRGKAPYKIYSLLCLFAYLFVVPTFMVNAAVDNSAYQAEAYRTFGSIEIDGDFNEPDWQEAKPVGQFRQVEPDAGEPMTLPTEVRILYDQENIYFGFTCFDSDVSKIIANDMRRDARELHENDYVFLILDPYNDKRTGVSFRINALGAVQDSAITNSGDSFNRNWDAVVDCQSRIHSDRWTSEFSIPFGQLRFKESEQMMWGLNLSRGIRRTNEEGTWAPVPSSYGGRAKYRTAYMGSLVGLEGIKPKKQIEFLPYILPGVSRIEEDGETAGEFEVGLDLKYGITTNLIADLTYNTDFAQVEADEEQVNLTRYSLFFPEKRPFFLEGAGLFEFGVPRPSFRRPPPFLLFYSRRIGIEDGHPIPIMGGGKITGKMGPYGVGLLNVFTNDFHTDESIIDPDDVVDVPRTNYSVLRLTRDLFTGSRVGLMSINKQDSDNYNRAGGLDFSYRPVDKLEIRGLWARTWDSEEDVGAGDARYIGSYWLGDLFRFSGAYTDIGDDFNPEVGYVRHHGSRRIRSETLYTPRPRKFGIREMRIGPEIDYVLTQENELQTLDVILGSRIELDNGERITFQAKHTREQLEEDFDIYDDVIIPVGKYDFNSLRVMAETDESKMFAGQFGVEVGNFYDGTQRGFDIDAKFKPNGRFVVETLYQFSRVELPTESFNANVLASRAVYSFSTRLFAKLFAQWNSADDVVAANFLLNYIYRPGSDFYLVFNQVFDKDSGAIGLSESTLVGKMTYWWNP